MSQLDYLRKARTQMAAAIETLSAHLERPGTSLTGKPYILTLADCPTHCLARVNGELLACAASDLLDGVACFSLEDAEQVAKAMVEQGESAMVPMLALDWQRKRLEDCRQSLAGLDALIAEGEPLIAPAA